MNPLQEKLNEVSMRIYGMVSLPQTREELAALVNLTLEEAKRAVDESRTVEEQYGVGIREATSRHQAIEALDKMKLTKQ